VALAALVLGAACLGGERGEITVGYAVETRLAEQPIVEPLEGPAEAGRELFLRLEVPELREETFVLVRGSRRLSGSFQQLFEFEQAAAPPWRVVVIPLSLSRQGEWLISVFASSRKLTDVELDVE
jgi:hypothetical protein